MDPHTGEGAARLSRLTAKARVRAAGAAERLLLGRRAGRLPQGTVRSIVESAWDPGLAAHVVDAHELSSPEITHFCLPDESPRWMRKTGVQEAR